MLFRLRTNTNKIIVRTLRIFPGGRSVCKAAHLIVYIILDIYTEWLFTSIITLSMNLIKIVACS
jgi:hypothetical protein